MKFDTLQVNTLQHATKPVWEIFDWKGTDTSGVVAYSNQTVNNDDYDNPNVNNNDELVIGSKNAFGTDDDISGNFGCVYYGNHPYESADQFTDSGRFEAKVDGIYKFTYHFAIQNGWWVGDRIPLFFFQEGSGPRYLIHGRNFNNGYDDQMVVISGCIVRRLDTDDTVRFYLGNQPNIVKLELSADEGYTSSGFTVTRL